MNEQDTVHQFPQVPADVPGEIRALKAGLRERIGDVAGLFRPLEADPSPCRGDRGGARARRGGLAGHRVRRHRGR